MPDGTVAAFFRRRRDGCTIPEFAGEGIMTSLPVVVADRPIGIVIQNGRPKTRGTAIWAYMWAADDEDVPHWHDLAPKARVA